MEPARVQKGSKGDPERGTAVVPRFDDEREFSRKEKSILVSQKTKT